MNDTGPAAISLFQAITRAAGAATFAVGALSVILALRKIAHALGAKRRARAMLLSASVDNTDLQAISASFRSGGVDEAQLARARSVIDAHLAGLPVRDRKLVREGLSQASRRGAVRFCRAILGVH